MVYVTILNNGDLQELANLEFIGVSYENKFVGKVCW